MLYTVKKNPTVLCFHRKIINPVKQVGAACTSVTNGDFSVKVNIPNKDEIGDCGISK